MVVGDHPHKGASDRRKLCCKQYEESLFLCGNLATHLNVRNRGGVEKPPAQRNVKTVCVTSSLKRVCFFGVTTHLRKQNEPSSTMLVV